MCDFVILYYIRFLKMRKCLEYYMGKKVII